MAATWPSIIALGATKSAPARAWLTAVFASSSTEASLPIRPSRTPPQCPWSVYSHRQTSDITTTSGAALLIARTASWTTPCSSYAPWPSGSLSTGSPKSITAGTPSAASSSTSEAASSIVRRKIPGMEGIAESVRGSSRTNSGCTRRPVSTDVSRTRARRAAVLLSRRARYRGRGRSAMGSNLREAFDEAADSVFFCDGADSESEGTGGRRRDWTDAHGLGLSDQTVRHFLREEVNEVGRRGRTREEYNVDPIRLPHEVDVGRRRYRVVRIRLDDCCAPPAQFVRKAFPREAGPRQEDRSPADVAEGACDRIGQELVRDHQDRQPLGLRRCFGRRSHGRDVSLEGGQVHAEGSRPFDDGLDAVGTGENHPVQGPPEAKAAVQIHIIFRRKEPNRRERDRGPAFLPDRLSDLLH